jgi:sirohydrochlorin ferrochelatase
MSPLDAPMTGLILFAHGARDPRWAEPFEAVAARMCARGPAWRCAWPSWSS